MNQHGKRFLLTSTIILLLVTTSEDVQGQDPCDNNACCVNPATCVVTDKQTLAGLTIDSIVPCDFTLGTYCTGGNGTTGIAPCPIGICGLNFCITGEPPATALNSLDHHWLQSRTTPKVVDFGSPVNTAIVFVAVDHEPFPEEGIESTVWGSNSCNISNFPDGWTLGTLTTIWKRGWEDPQDCQGQDNADDFVGQYSFLGVGFRYVAVHADFSISIFDDPSHTTWEGFADNSGVPGWQSFDDEIDAVGTPDCGPGDVVADAGPDQTANVGEQICFDGSGSSAVNGISLMGWDLDGDGEIDVNGPVACVDCTEPSSGEVTLFVTDTCGCVDSDTALFTCTEGAQSALDIKPGSCPNSFNRHSHGVLPVALVGTASFDVTQVDLDSILLKLKDDPDGPGVPPHEGPPGPHTTLGDSATPFAGEEQCDCHELEGDGVTDLNMKFKTDDVVAVLGLDDFSPGALVSLTLTGTLNDGTPFTADDCIVILPPGDHGPISATVGSNVGDTFIEVTPLDLNIDSDGFTRFGRAYYAGTLLTVTAPPTSEGRRFVRWRVDGVLQEIGVRTIEVAVAEDTTLQALYHRQRRLRPDRPTELDAPLD